MCVCVIVSFSGNNDRLADRVRTRTPLVTVLQGVSLGMEVVRCPKHCFCLGVSFLSFLLTRIYVLCLRACGMGVYL